MVAIKDVEMPKYCMTCQFYDQMYNRCNIGHFDTNAKFIKGDDKWYFKHPNCPLVEIGTCKECYNAVKKYGNGRIYCLFSNCIYDEDFCCKKFEKRGAENE